MYLVPLADNVVSIVRPADRKFVGQWLKKDRSNVISSYLQQVAGRLTDRQSVSIAVDLEDVLSMGILNEKLAQSKSLQGKNIEAIAKSLSLVQGITISVASDALEATVLIDFLNTPTELTPVAKAFFAEVLTARGMQLDEFSQWKMSAISEGKTLSFTGPIAPETLDDLLGMFTVHRASRGVTPVTKTDSPATPTAPQTSPSVVAENTRDYFRKVINIVHRVRDYSANNTGERAQWNGNMANRIDEMPTLEVDPQMVMFGAEVAKSLRSNSMSMQLTNISQGAAAVAADAGTGAFSDTGVTAVADTWVSFKMRSNGNNNQIVWSVNGGAETTRINAYDYLLNFGNYISNSAAAEKKLIKDFTSFTGTTTR
jgi:hypothetical protein